MSATVKFELADEPGTFVLAWTTTPWTSIGNVALAIGEDVDYVKVHIPGEGLVAEKVNYRRRVEKNNIYHYILAKDRVEDELVKRGKEFEVAAEFKGSGISW